MGIYRSGKCRLRQILKEKKITQTELSDKTGIPANQINDYVNNRRKMSLDTAYNVSRGLGGIPVESLYEWEIWRRE